MLRGSNYFSSLICSHNSELWIYGSGSISSSFSGMIQLTQGKEEISLSGQEVSVLIHIYIFSSVHSLSRDQLFATPWTAACQASLSITNSQSLLKLLFIESVMPSNQLILSTPSLPAFSPPQHQGFFQWVSSSHQVAKVLELQFRHQSVQWIVRVNCL